MWKSKNMSEGITKSEDLWTPYKEFYRAITYYFFEENVNAAEFENLLRKHKQSFFALLHNPPKNAKSREDLKKGMEDGITVKEIGHQVLSKDLYQEAIILSDMYDLNEFVALDLLCTAQIQMPYYYGLPRGLVAVVLYYEGRKCLVSALRLLVQARNGVSWNLKVKKELRNFITVYTDQLMENGLFNRIFELLRTLDLSKELEKLQENVALGGPRHRKQVIELFNDIRQILAETVFLWSAQCGLPKEPTLVLINFLRQLKTEEDATGTVDNVTLYLLLAVLSVMDLSVLHFREDGEDVVQKLPILAEKDYVQMLCTELSPAKPKWVSEGLQATATFGLAVSLACLRLVPQGIELQSAIDKEVSFLCVAIEMKAFEFLNHKFLTNQTLYTDQVPIRRIHYLFTDFIVQMFSKVKELRIKADETARMMQVYVHEGLEPPPNLPRHFEHFMQALATFYTNDPLNLQYSSEYWCPIESVPHESYSYRAPSRSVSLFKFIRLAGDSIPSTLFVPFLNMLTSLSTCPQAARHCFNMLKQVGPGYNNSISWDHFFTSFNQYYNNLKQEVPPMTDTVYRRGVHPRGITPQEIEGLQAVLKLMRTIAERDDFSRLALCEHPGWAPLTVFLGLTGCAVPTPFKAELLLTLAALAKSPETAVQMWNNVEAAQILITVPSTSNYRPRGIQTELDEIESRLEEYPLTRSLLKLLDVLTDFGIPRTLGAGPRKPGFDPYLTFIVNSVFLKFNMRTYKSTEERWLVGTMCLKLLEKFLLTYEPQSADFPDTNKPNEFNSPPGFHLMLQMNSKSEFLNLILSIIEEGHNLFQQHTSLPGQKYIEECTLRCLNMLERALTLQNTFFGLLATSPSPVFLTHLNKLLFIINPRSGQPDYCLTISKYLCFKDLLPQHSLVAVKILLHITSLPSLHSQYFNILLSQDKDSKLIRGGFVECLDIICINEDTEIAANIKEVILKLLKQCLGYSSNNLSHFLFGFDLRHDISQTVFQQAGVHGYPRTCLHSLFTILKGTVTKGQHTPQPALLESVYHMMYLLCANLKTSEPVLLYIRQNQSFFRQHLDFCVANANEGVTQLNQLSWLLKTIAIELKLMCHRNQLFYLQQLSALLVGTSDFERAIPTDTFSIIHKPDDSSKANSSLSYYGMGSTKSEKLLVKLLKKFELTSEEVISPKWECIDNNMLEGLLNSCQTDSNPKLVDIRKLHHTLIDEVTAMQGGSAVGQRQALMQEIQKVLLHALNINNNRNSAAAIVRYVDSWRQVVEVIAVYMPFEVISATDQQLWDISLLEIVLKKATTINLLPDVGIHLSGALLILMENMRRCHLKEKQQRVNNQTITDATTESIVQANAGPLKGILSSLIEWALTSSVSSSRLRMNLYTSLVTFLQLLHLDEPVKNAQLENSFYVSRLDSSKLHVSDDPTSLYVPADIFSVFGEKLIELVCHDCISGQDISKMLAMSSFSLLISLSGNVNWIIYMAGRGYLKHIIESILNDDRDLVLILEPTPTNLRAMYLHVSKLSLLSQLATTKLGAELLLEHRILSCLSSMRVFALHPEILRQSQVPPAGLEDFIPPVSNRYLQMFLPTLHLCNSIITSLSGDNLSAVTQVMYYLLSHLDVVELVLRSGNPSLSQDFLEELAVLTSVIARTTNVSQVFIRQSAQNIQDNRAHLHRIQKLMFGLLPKFLLSEDVLKDLLANPQQEGPSYQTSHRLLHALHIISNLISYTGNLIGSSPIDNLDVAVVFQPSLGEIFTQFNAKKQHGDQPPTLGVLVQHLINAVNHYHQGKGSLDFLQRRMSEIPEMMSGDLKDFLKLPQDAYDVNLMRENALNLVADKLDKKKQEFDYYSFIIGNSLYLLWVHLDYYMLRAIPMIRQREMASLNAAFNLDATLASASEATWKVSADDISNLKQGLVSVFNDSFSRQLVETAQGESEVSKQFTATLLRKIKRLIQFVPVK